MKIDYNKLFILSVCFNVVFLLLGTAFVIKKGGISWVMSKVSPTAAEVQKPPYYFDKTSQFDILPQKEGAIVFIGDSLTDGVEWSELFANSNIINRGINKVTTQGILEMVNSVADDSPSKIFFMAGTNDLDQSVEKETTKNNYKSIIEEIQKKSPDTKIYVQSILPINNELNGSKVSSETIVDLNNYLENLSSEYDNCEFIDLYSHFQVDGQMNTDYTNDGTHLNGQGYLLWKEQIQDFVNG